MVLDKYKSVAISGVPGSGKATVARKVTEITGLPLFQIGEMWRKRWDAIEGCKPVFEEWWPKTPPNANLKITREVCEMIISRPVIGDFPYPYPKFFSGTNVVLVFINAPIETRVARARGIGKCSGKSDCEIQVTIEQRERDEVDMGHNIFGAGYDYRNPDYYDIVFNSARLTAAQIAQVIVQAMVI